MSTSGDDPTTIDDILLPSTPKTPIDRERWNMAWLFIHERLLAREELEASFQLLIEQGTQAALDYIQVTVAPRLEELQVDIDAARAAIEDLIEEGTAPNSAKLGNQLPSFYATADDLAALDSDVDIRIAALVSAAPGALDTLKELADALGNDASFATTVTNALAGKLALSGGTMTGPLLLTDADAWRYRCRIGDYYCADTSLTGVDIPPTGTDGPVFIQLTAGLTGAGQFNAGKLKDETVSGSAPDVLATAVIDFDGSPMDGQTIRLLNTEGRIIRPYPTSGTVLGDAIRNITGSIGTGGHDTSGGVTDPSGVFFIDKVVATPNQIHVAGTGNYASRGMDASRVVPTADENRMKMLGETWYRRIA